MNRGGYEKAAMLWTGLNGEQSSGNQILTQACIEADGIKSVVVLFCCFANLLLSASSLYFGSLMQILYVIETLNRILSS